MNISKTIWLPVLLIVAFLVAGVFVYQWWQAKGELPPEIPEEVACPDKNYGDKGQGSRSIFEYLCDLGDNEYEQEEDDHNAHACHKGRVDQGGPDLVLYRYLFFQKVCEFENDVRKSAAVFAGGYHPCV